MNSYLEILFWTITIYIIAVAIVHFAKVLPEKKDNNTNLTKAIIYLTGGLALAMLLLYKPFGESVKNISEKITKRPVSDAAVITTTTMGSTAVSV
jgi:hypothetical protein